MPTKKITEKKTTSTTKKTTKKSTKNSTKKKTSDKKSTKKKASDKKTSTKKEMKKEKKEKKISSEPKSTTQTKTKTETKNKTKTQTKNQTQIPKNSITYTEPIQPEMNIGLVGHVDHGKTTLTEKLSGKWTDTHSEELKRGITIKLGYADTILRKCPECKGTEAYTTKKVCPIHECTTEPLKKISFVDAPGHESLMATMLSGATIMDGAILMVAANEVCPQLQTKEHLMALEMGGIKDIIVIQNKIDLVDEERALKNYQQIKEFLSTTSYKDAPIIPVCAQRGINIDLVIKTMLETFKTPKRDPEARPLMLIARSFDINKPGTTTEQLKGGVLGGALKTGKLRVGDKIQISPGRVVSEANKLKAKPLKAVIKGIITGGKKVEEIVPGGSIALLTDLDHGIVKSDSLTGNIVGLEGDLPPVHYDLVLETHILDRVVGSEDELKVAPFVKNEPLMLNVNSAVTVGIIQDISKDKITLKLKKPVSANIGARVVISRRIGTIFRLIGYGIIQE